MKSTKAVRAARRPMLRAAGLTPLLLSMAIYNAYAADVTKVGAKGLDGVDATMPYEAGTAGAAGAGVTHLVGGNTDAVNRLTLTGGAGGRGGKGAPVTEVIDFPELPDYQGPRYNDGPSGRGGDGGNAAGAVRTLSGTLDGVAVSRVAGGHGGSSGMPDNLYPTTSFDADTAPGASGGSALSAASVVAGGAAAVLSQASAVGGNGGLGRWSFINEGADGGAGGAALAVAYGHSDTGNVVVGASASGGNGGGSTKLGGTNGAGAAVALVNAVSGATSGELTLNQQARGGTGGNGGNAASTLTLLDARAAVLRANVDAIGGEADLIVAPRDAGNAYAGLTLESTRAGARLEGTVSATGGANVGSNRDPSTVGTSGRAEAVGMLRGRGDVDGNAVATGGDARNAGSGGLTSADLTIVADGLATGRATAYGGTISSYGDNPGDFAPRYQDAAATLTLSGAGARGNAYALGGNATSTVNAVTSGALAVDVASRADGAGAVALATTTVRMAPGGGTAGVNAGAHADGGNRQGAAEANVWVASGGAIVGTSYAKGGYGGACCSLGSGLATSNVHGETSGRHDVTLRAGAYSHVVDERGTPAQFGDAVAGGYGRSGSGVADVRSEARGGFAWGSAEARATAVTTQRGGISNAMATASGAAVSVSASALAAGARGNAGFSASASGRWIDSATAYASSQFSQTAFDLPAPGETYLRSAVMAAPDAAAALALSPDSAKIDHLVGAGMHAGSAAMIDGAPTLQASGGSFAFESGAGEHVWLAFLSGFGSGFDLSISNHGVALFSRSFTSGDEAALFFNGTLLDLGVFGAGMQDLLIQSSLSIYGGGAYGFNYLVGTGAGATAVPEASTWLMMIIGMGGMLLVARRRSAGAEMRA